MRIKAPLSKSIMISILVASVWTAFPAFAQKRARSPQRSVSKAAGLVDEADKLLEDKKYPEAIEAYKLAIRLDANYAPAFGGLGDAYLNSGNSEQALVAYKERCYRSLQDGAN